MRTINQTVFAAVFVLAAAFLTGCGPKSVARPNSEAARSIQTTTAAWPDPLSIVLAPQEGKGKTDDEIRRFQNQVRQGRNRNLALEQLGWVFVSKARESFDAG